MNEYLSNNCATEQHSCEVHHERQIFPIGKLKSFAFRCVIGCANRIDLVFMSECVIELGKIDLVFILKLPFVL